VYGKLRLLSPRASSLSQGRARCFPQRESMAKLSKPGCSTAQWHKVRLILTGALVGTLITGRLQAASMFASQRLAEVSALPSRTASSPDASIQTSKRKLFSEIALQQNTAQEQRQAQHQHQAELRNALRTSPSLDSQRLETHSLQAHRNYSLAVVMPFIDAQLPKLFKCFEHWHLAPPCDASLPAALLLYHPTSATDSNVSLAEISGKLGHSAGCFSLGIELLWANLSAAVAWSHPDGTCGQFYMLFSLLRSRFDYFYLMEPDAIAIRPNSKEASLAALAGTATCVGSTICTSMAVLSTACRPIRTTQG
jgi:hypothetical protein